MKRMIMTMTVLVVVAFMMVATGANAETFVFDSWENSDGIRYEIVQQDGTRLVLRAKIQEFVDRNGGDAEVAKSAAETSLRLEFVDLINDPNAIIRVKGGYVPWYVCEVNALVYTSNGYICLLLNKALVDGLPLEMK